MYPRCVYLWPRKSNFDQKLIYLSSLTLCLLKIMTRAPPRVFFSPLSKYSYLTILVIYFSLLHSPSSAPYETSFFFFFYRFFLIFGFRFHFCRRSLSGLRYLATDFRFLRGFPKAQYISLESISLDLESSTKADTFNCRCDHSL